eukprot:4906144-Alexandrium_andersonii.AAC.1
MKYDASAGKLSDIFNGVMDEEALRQKVQPELPPAPPVDPTGNGDKDEDEEAQKQMQADMAEGAASVPNLVCCWRRAGQFTCAAMP